MSSVRNNTKQLESLLSMMTLVRDETVNHIILTTDQTDTDVHLQIGGGMLNASANASFLEGFDLNQEHTFTTNANVQKKHTKKKP